MKRWLIQRLDDVSKYKTMYPYDCFAVQGRIYTVLSVNEYTPFEK